MSENTTPQPQDAEGLEPEVDQATEAPDQPESPEAAPELSREEELERMLAERTEDLQRLQAEYVNYKRRVDRDRALSRQLGVESVVGDLMPVLDSIDLARQHEDNSPGFQMIADALAKLAGKHGLVSFGQVGDVFDPVQHEALMQAPMPEGDEITETTVSQVIQAGYRLGDRVVRPARVGVASPE